MIKRIISLLSFLYLALNGIGQETNQKVFTTDIDNFWKAFDSVQTTRDSAQQVAIIQSMYVAKGTVGLRSFMSVRDYSAEKWVKLINRSPKFWASIRPNTLTVKEKADLIESSIKRFKELYPELSDAKMYFTIGGLSSGGTTMGKLILIGSEIATGTVATDVSDLPEGTSKWLGSVFKQQQLNNIIPLNIHEYVHTQQKGQPSTLLGLCIREGACDFITELVIGEPMQNNYIQYGRLHDKELKEKFKEEMYTAYYANWLYNGSKAQTVGDLGYYMGYAICKSYYQNATDKQQAIREIIELKYANTSSVEEFLAKSKFYNESFDKSELIKKFEEKRPNVVSIEPIANGDSTINSTIKEMKIVFSQAMDPDGISLKWGSKGKPAYPIVGIIGFSEDKKTFSVKVDLLPDRDYEFMITDLGFKSKTGYPLKPYTVKFKSR